jgi:choline monooxygenase
VPPAAYFEPARHARELSAVLEPAWHLAASVDEIPRDGDFVTREILGRPILLRNHEGAPRAFINVCAHRHTLLVLAPSGSAKRIRCPYHGWEYDGEGAVCKMPEAACFAPVRRGSERLAPVALEALGNLLFVRLTSAGGSLDAQLGAAPGRFVREHFGRALRLAVRRDLDHPCNWKIPIENVLESYHVPLLHDGFLARHPRLFRFFEGAPRGGGPAHVLGEGYTSVRDRLGPDSRVYRGLVEMLRPGASVDFELLHVFPNLILGKSGLVSFAQCVLPISPTASRSLVWMFLDLGQRGRGLAERALAPIADAAAAMLFDRLMREDSRIFPKAQRGMESSGQLGVLGAHEERIHHFHSYLMEHGADAP